jgi:pimeloyl-ACP methyl ester carboxylesterase
VRAVRIAVVYVHGLWMTGIEGIAATAFGQGTRCRDTDVRVPSVGAGIAANARSLAKRLSRLRADTLHLVGHSLGGVVICKMFEEGGGASFLPGRVVLLGSPVAGSRAAHRLPNGRSAGSSWGAGVREELLVRP